MTEFMARHGDVLIVSIDKLPKGLEEKKDRIIVAGLSSGHNHRVEGDAQVYIGDEGTFVRVGSTVKLTHEEHATIELAKGNYKAIN